MRYLLLLISGAFSSSARWLFLAIVMLIPWLFGGTREWTIRLLLIALYATCGLWLLGRLGEWALGRTRRRWGIPPALMVLSALAAMLGWSIAWNAHSYFDPYLLQFIP